MALTFTTAGLETQLQTVATALDASDFAAARTELAKAQLILLRIPTKAGAGATFVEYQQQINQLKDLIADAEAATSATDRRRLIRTGLAHG